MIVSHPPPELAYTRAGVVYIGAAAVARGHDPSVSADGRWIAYVSGEHGNPELYVARPGQTPVRITFTPRAAEAAPAWSPDGRHLAFQRGRDLWIGAVDRGSERLVARNGSSPSWSSLGRIAFERGRLDLEHPPGRAPGPQARPRRRAVLDVGQPTGLRARRRGLRRPQAGREQRPVAGSRDRRAHRLRARRRGVGQRRP